MSHRFLLSAALLLGLSAPAATAQSALMGPHPGLRGLSGSVSVGAMSAGRLGSASYLSPLLQYHVSPRLQVFAGGTYLRTYAGALVMPTDVPGALPAIRSYSHYLLQGGATYALSPRLALTGTAWKDLTPLGQGARPINPYATFGPTGQGVNLRADYQVTEHFSVSGGVRVSQGGYPGYGLLNPTLGY